MSADYSDWRESVRQDALSQGLPPDVAEHLAEEVGRQAGPPTQRTERAERIERMVRLYGGPPSLASEFATSTSHLKGIAALLARNTGPSGRMSSAGVESCRIGLLQHSITRGHQA